MKITIFYSWQTSTDTKYNKNFILSCIEKAVKKAKQKPELKGVDFVIQEGVRGEPGSPPVASKIMDDRIQNCDIFIADLSVVTHNFPIGLPKKYLKELKHSIKASPNPNVILEYGIAYKSLGAEKIIGIMNSHYGSPKIDNDTLPFDFRHLRFPIEYDFSPVSDDKERIQNGVVDDLASALKSTAVFALAHQKTKFSPFSVWSEWEKTLSSKQEFIKNSKIEEIKESILNTLKNKKQSIRVLGLSGIGKTRILLEIFKPIQSDGDSILLSSRVLYLNCNLHQNVDYQTIFKRVITENVDYIIILDNCSKSLHRQLLPFIEDDSNKVSLITIDSNPEEFQNDIINKVNNILIKKDDFIEIIDEILKRDFSMLSQEQVEKIKEFSQGIPLMAVLLAESIQNDEKFIGKLDDKDLLDKLLGQEGKDNKNRTILQACSIFNYFGFYDELRSQYEFIAKNKSITCLSGDEKVIIHDFHKICKHYLKREIFEQKGRFISMRPFPLAMSLAQEWLETCTDNKLIDVIIDIAKLPEPDRHNLSEALAERMKYLGYDDKAILIVEKITGLGSPFDNAEVLNTELGSRLFRSFVEVNPIAISKNLKRLFSNKTTEELLLIIEGRRNLVWVLEKICFDERTFNDSVKLLMAFAVAENETCSNNATGQFLSLFNLFLSGTQAKLIDRWRIIQWGLGHSDEKYYDLAFKAMKVGLNYGHFHRMGGSEKQGTKSLEDNEPTVEEVKVYWKNIFIELVKIIKLNNNYSLQASDMVANSIRSIFNARIGGDFLHFMDEVSKYKNFDWDKGLQGLRAARKYEKSLMNEVELNQVNELIKLLTKTDFITRYTNLSSSFHLDDDEIYSSEKEKRRTIELANEFIQTNIPWEETFPTLLSKQQSYSYYFGQQIFKQLIENKERINEFIQTSLKTIKYLTKEERNVTVLGGFLSEATEEIKKDFYLNLFGDDDLNNLLFYFLSIDVFGAKYYHLLFELINSGKCDVSLFYTFNYSNSLRQLDIEKLNDFSTQLFGYGDEGYAIIFDLFFNIGYDDNIKKQALIPIYKECIYKFGINKKEKRQLDGYKWSMIISYIITNDKETEFAKFINNSIINSITWENSYHLDNNIQKIYEILMKVHFNSIWEDLSKALLSIEEKYMTFYGLKHILGSNIGSSFARGTGILFEGDIETIFVWCNNNLPLAPSRLAELTPIFDTNNTNYSVWNPIALRLINEFGNIEKVLIGLSTNMGTYSWTGSVVPLLEGKKDLFETLRQHQLEEVRRWANSSIEYLERYIEQEKIRDAESYLY